MFSYKHLPFGADSIMRKDLACCLIGGTEMNNTEGGKYVAKGRKGQLGGREKETSKLGTEYKYDQCFGVFYL